MASNTSQLQSTTSCSSYHGGFKFKLATNPNLNMKEKYLQAWLAGETNIGRFLIDDVAVAKPPNSRPLQSTTGYQSRAPAAFPPPYPVTESQFPGSSSSSQTFWSCPCISSKSDSDSPPQPVPLVHSPGTIISPPTPAELPLTQHTTRSHNVNDSCHWEGAPPFSELFEFPASQKGCYYFVSDPCNPSRILLPQSSIPLSELQIAGHCPAIIDEIYDRFSPERVNSMTLEDVEYDYCTVVDARHLLFLDQSILEAQIALDLLHLQSKFYDLSHLKSSISKSEATTHHILRYCKKKDIEVDFITLQVFRPDRAQSEWKKCKAREKEVRPHLDAMIGASKGVQMFSDDPSSLLEGRLRFEFLR